MVKKKKIKSKNKPSANAIVGSVDFLEEAQARYYEYGVAVNEDRAIPCGITGLKPVAKRALWATYKEGGHSNAKFSKAAVYVGNTIAYYHPHGTDAAYGAFVTMANSCIPLIQGEGNWGSFSDRSYAAMRYTEMRLSAFTDAVFFDKFYLPALQMVPNYDYSRDEPLILTALLPNLLLNGSTGIGVGVSVEIPAFTIDSVSRVLKKALADGKEVTGKDCSKLEFTTMYGGSALDNKEERKKVFETGKGRIHFVSSYEMVDKHTAHYTRFASFNLVKAIERIAELKDVISVNDISDVTDRYGKLEITFKKTLLQSEVILLADKIAKDQLGSVSSFDISVTDRFIDDIGDGAAKLRKTSVVQIFNDWITYRIDLEKRACTYWIKQNDKEIEKLELMLLAVKFRDVLIALLSNKKLDDAALAEQFAKKAKITVDQANFILDLKIRALKSLEAVRLNQKISDIRKESTSFKKRIKHPTEYIAQHVTDLTKKISAAYPS